VDLDKEGCVLEVEREEGVCDMFEECNGVYK